MYRHDLASGWHQIGEDRWVDGQPGVGVEMLGALESEIDSAPWLVFAGRHRHDMGAGWHSRAEGRVCLKRVCFIVVQHGHRLISLLHLVCLSSPLRSGCDQWAPSRRKRKVLPPAPCSSVTRAAECTDSGIVRSESTVLVLTILGRVRAIGGLHQRKQSTFMDRGIEDSSTCGCTRTEAEKCSQMMTGNCGRGKNIFENLPAGSNVDDGE